MRYRSEPLAVGVELTDGGSGLPGRACLLPPNPNAFGHAWVTRLDGSRPMRGTSAEPRPSTKVSTGQPTSRTAAPPAQALSTERAATRLARGPGCAQGLLVKRSSTNYATVTPLLLGNDLAARDLRRVGNRRVEVLVGDPLRDELRGLVGLLGGLEETERAQDAVAGLDQVVAGEAGELAELRDERLVDLADDLVRAGMSTPS